jgi:hypothetical protein
MGRTFKGRTISQLNRRRPSATPNRLAMVNRRRRWVLHLWEAFLIHMDDFDRLLEFQLRRQLDVLVAAPVPARQGRSDDVDSGKSRRGKDIKHLGRALVLLEHP